jgi:hypothetical protein
MLETGRRHGGWQRLVTVVLLLFSTQGAWALSVQDQVLHYDVSYSSTPAGEIEITIAGDDEGYVVSATTYPNMIASMFLDEYTNETRYRRNQDLLELATGHDQLRGDKDFNRSFTVDYDKGEIQYDSGKVVPVAESDRLEAISFPILLMDAPDEVVEGTKVRQVSTKRVRNFIYEKPQTEVVKVPAGEFTCTRYTRHRIDKPETTVTIWLSQDENPVPVRISSTNKGATSVMELTKAANP